MVSTLRLLPLLIAFIPVVVPAQWVETERAADFASPVDAPLDRGQVEYTYDDGTGNVNIGPPSTFDPDMLWGNYFLTQAGGDVITEIRVAFGPTFPSLADGPVTFWLLDDPEMNLDPLSATAVASVQATPDVFGNSFYHVEIPPTQVGGAFFVGASAQLQGGQDRPARVDTDGPPENSWFFYAPDISEVINDLASAPFGTSMDNPEYVPFPGAFMVRAIGIQGEYTPPQAEVQPDELYVIVFPDDTTSTQINLANVAPDGAEALTFSASIIERDSDILFSIEPKAGSIPPGTSEDITITISTQYDAYGAYLFDLRFETNDPQNVELLVPLAVEVPPMPSTEVEGGGALALEQNRPNPFTGQTEIAFSLLAGGPVRIDVVDLAGRHVAALLHADLPAGEHVVTWDATGLAPGVYVYRIQAGAHRATRRAVVVR